LSLATVNPTLPPLVTTYQNTLEKYFGHTCHIYGAAAPSSTHCALYSFMRLPFLETTWSRNKTKPVSMEIRLDRLV